MYGPALGDYAHALCGCRSLLWLCLALVRWCPQLLSVRKEGRGQALWTGGVNEQGDRFVVGRLPSWRGGLVEGRELGADGALGGFY